MALSRNPDYWMQLSCNSQGVDIIANAPEQIVLSVASSWESRMPSSLQDIPGVAGGAIGLGANALNMNVAVQWLTHQSWISSTPIEITLTLLFDAQTDAYVDVVEPMKKLQKLVLPYRRSPDSQILMPPGPAAISADQDEARTSLRIGRMLYLPSVIVVSANNTYDTRLNGGYPISGQTELTVRSIVMPTREDLDLIM